MFLLLCSMVRAETPVFTISSQEAEPGAIIDVNFNVNSFTNLIAAQMSVNWDQTVLKFRTLKNLNESVTGLTPLSFGTFASNVDNGRFTMSWFESNVMPVNLPDNSLFFTVEFEVIGAPCASSSVAITNNPLEIFFTEDEVTNVGAVSNTGTVNVAGVGCLSDITLNGTTQNAVCGTQVCIPFTVQNFTGVGSMEFSMSYNPAILQFSEIKNFGPLPAFNEGTTNLVSPGLFRVLWLNPNIENISLPDGTVLFELCFDVIGAGSTDVTFGTSPIPVFTDIDGVELPNAIVPGVVNATCALQGFAFIAETECVMPGQEICIDIQVNDFDEIVAFQFDLVWNPALFDYVGVQSFGIPQLEDAFGDLEVGSGKLTVSWLDFTLNGVSVPDLTTIFQLCLRAKGPVGQTSALTFTGEVLASNVDDEVDVQILNGQIQILNDCEGCNVSYVINATSPTCPGGTNGAIDLVVTESCPESPTFQWSANAGNATTEDVSGLSAGTYMVTITVGSTIVVATHTISNPASISATGVITDPVPLNASNGSINLTVSGGTSPYTFIWNTNPPQTTEDLSNIGVGTYIVTITDANGCQFTPDAFIVGAELAAQITHVGCPGANNGAINLSASFGTGPYTFVWNTTPPQTTEDIAGLSAGNYCVTVTDSGGLVRDTCFTVNDADPVNLTANITHDVNENCGGAIDLNVTGGTLPYTYVWSHGPMSQDIISLCPGQYCVTVTYGNGCTATQCFNVFSGDVGINLTATQISCNGECDGSISAQVQGGVQPLTYRWSNNLTTPTISNLCAGIYSLTVTDANGATLTSSIQLNAPPAITADINVTLPTDYSSTNGAISVVAGGGDPPFVYSWTGPVSGNTPALNNLPAGTYTLQITDSNGCVRSFTVPLLPEGGDCYEGTPVITPNSDGKNDFLIITCVYDAPNVLYIFNRNGGLVYTMSNYNNSWEGTYDDFSPVPDGGYHWVLDVKRPQGTELFKGTVYVLRTAD